MKGLHYDIAAKPTLYKKIQFRSRLEAFWAAVFDIKKWRWEYESQRPEFRAECRKARYIPDFLLSTESCEYIIEVRPNYLWKESRKRLNQIDGAEYIILVGEDASWEHTYVFNDDGLEIGYELDDVTWRTWKSAQRRVMKGIE